MKNSQNKGQTVNSNSVNKNEEILKSLTQADKFVGVKNPNEINYKQCDFDYLVSNVETKVLKNCFCKILSFLDNASSLEMEFRNISKILDEILVRIVKDVNVLNTKNMYGKCKAVCSNIVEQMNMYSSETYTLAYSYKREAQNALYAGLGGNSTDILVYKKIYHSKISESLSSISSRQGSPLSRSPSSDSGDSSKSNVGTPQPLTDYFETHSLNLILKFVKDKTQQRLVFTNLTTEKAEFVHSVFSSVIGDSVDGVAVKEICLALWEAVKLFSLKYEFSIQYIESIKDKKSLMLEKEERDIPRMPSEIFDVDKECVAPISKQLKKQRLLIRCLSPNFITSSLRSVLNFYQDNTEASLVFSNVNANSANLLTNVINFCRSSKIKSLFEKEAQQIFDEIQVLNESVTHFKLKIKEKRSKSGQKEIHFKKVPNYDKVELQTEKPSRQWYPLVSSKDPYNDESTSKLMMVDKTLESITHQRASCPNLQYRQSNSPHQQNVTSAKAKLRKKSKSSKWRGVPKRNNQQLIEALSVPVKSDKAIKMMLGMGWTGGALGSRGDGITEPIMPHLTAVAGAGLGHVKSGPVSISNVKFSSNKKEIDDIKNGAPGVKRNMPEFQMLYLEELLEFLTSSNDTKTISFHPTLKKKEKTFIRNAMKFFSSRSYLKMLNNELQELFDEIIDEFRRDRELTVFACIEARRQVVLKKIHTDVTPLKKRNKEPPEIPDDVSLEENAQYLLDCYGSVCETDKVYANIRYRVILLLQLLKFIKNDAEKEIEIEYAKEIKARERRHLEKSIEGINNRVTFGATGPEVAVSQMIKTYMGFFNLHFTYQNIKGIKVTKEYPIEEYTNFTETVFSPTSDKHCDLNSCSDSEISENEFPHSKTDVVLDNKFTDTLRITTDEDEFVKDNAISYSNNVHDKIIENIVTNDEEIVFNGIRGVNLFENGNKNDNIDVMPDWHGDYIENTELLTQEAAKASTSNEEVKTVITDKQDGNKPSEQSTPEITIESNSVTDNINECLDITIDRMSVSEHSQSDYSALGIDDISMSEEKLTDWDPKTPDNSEESDNLNSNLDLSSKNTKLAANKKKQSKTKLSKFKIDVKLVSLTKPFISATDLRKYIQRIISINIIKSEKLPLLQCYGVQNGALIYSCHDKKSYDWLLDLCMTNGVFITNMYYNKMSFKINWCYDSEDREIFNLLDMYNKDISTERWNILKREVLEDCLVFTVKMDKHSFRYILNSDLVLYAGVDKVYFSIIWE